MSGATENLSSVIDHLKTLKAYVPPAVLRVALEDPAHQPGGTWRRFHAATAFADISGFTPLAEELAASGVRGAEELTAILNRVFEDLITVAESHGARVEVVKFGGDALSLIWPCQPDAAAKAEAVRRAVQTAFAMQTRMARFSTISVSEGDFALRMKIGISVGELLEVHAGGVFDRWEYVLAGSPMANMAEAENHATADEVVVDQAAWELLRGRLVTSETEVLAEPPLTDQTDFCVFGQPAGPNFYRITHFWGSLSQEAPSEPDWSALDLLDARKVVAILGGYIPGAIKSVLGSGHRDMLAELKPMTVCFVGFEGIDYDHDPQAGPRLANFMRDAQEMIYHYEGSVNKLAVGDKGSLLLVLFGAPPFFHEDDEVRGVACALMLQQVAARYDLKLRVGLAAGPLFAGPVGPPQRREYTVVGDTVNLAARLMQRADFGQVWVDHGVQRQAARFFEYKDLGEISVKGKTEPRRVFQAVREREQDREEMVMSYLLSNQELTGREEELQLVDRLADRVWDGQGQVLLLSGEAGVGKSRLAAEIVRRWMMRGGVSHGGDCVSYGSQTPYLPWRGVISSLAGLSPRLSVDERLDRLERLLRRLSERIDPAGGTETALPSNGYWLERLPLLAEILGLDAVETALTRNLTNGLRRDNLFAVIRAIILGEAQQRPILVVLEDTHWSDELSLALAAALAPEISNHAVCLALVHRPLSEPIPLEYQRIAALSHTKRLHVSELDVEAGLKLVKSKLGVKTLPPALADLISSKGQGNPFFIEELVNSLLGMGVLVVEGGAVRLVGDLNEIDLPNTVQRVVLARIDRLPEEEKVTLKVAAAIGRTFQSDLLRDVHPWLASTRTLNEQLARLQAEDFTRPEGPDNDLDFLFKHVITREVAYETMLYAQRRQLHATIGAALENRARANESEIIDLLAYHYALSNDRPKALHYLQRAGEKALFGNANEAAISYFSQALDVAQEIGDFSTQYDLLAGRERAYNRIGKRAAQAEDLLVMKQIALDLGNAGITRLLDTGNRHFVLLTNLGKYAEAVTLAEEMLRLALNEGEVAWEARTLSNLGITYWRRGNYTQAQEAMQRSLALEEKFNSPRLRANILNYLGLIRTRLADYTQARRDYQQALQLYRALDDRAGESSCANNLGLLEVSLGRYEAAQGLYQQALSICQSIGDRQLEGISLNILGQVDTLLGAYQQAQERLTRSMAIRQTIGDRRGEAFCLHDMGSLYLAQNQPAQAAEYFDRAGKLRLELGEQGNYIASLAAKGAASLAAGSVNTAVVALREAVEHLTQGGSSGEYPPQQVWWAYVRLCQARGSMEEAGTALATARQLVQAKAAQIKDPAYRRSYLENVRVNAAIMAT